ncbi:MAG: dephospho-CoA kinase [Rhodanobacteraceae bacterium]
MSLYTIALTGGVASGKSEVAHRFAAFGAAIIDADTVARELVAPGKPQLARVVEEFGSGVVTADGQLDRSAVRSRIFADPASRQRLEAILHPAIWHEMQRRVSIATAAYALLVIPLLVENKLQARTDRVLLIDVPREMQLRRLVLRDRIAADLAEAMLAAQASREDRLAVADDVLDNSGHPDALDDQVARLHIRYLELAQQKRISL